MLPLKRTCLGALVSATTVLAATACGHVAFDELPVGGEALTSDAGPGNDARSEGGASGGDGSIEGGRQDDGGGPADGGIVDATVSDSSVTDAAGGTDGAVVDAGCTLFCTGIFVSQSAGSDANPGTALLPVKTINRGLKLAALVPFLAKVDVKVAEGHYKEAVTLRDGVNLLGGFKCDDLPCDWSSRDLTRDTQIVNTELQGVVAPSTVTRATTFEGFHVMGLDGPLDNAPTTIYGGVGMSLLGGTPQILHSTITGGTIKSGTGTRRSVGIAIGGSNDLAGALIDTCIISGGPASDASVGVLFENHPTTALGEANAVILRSAIKGDSAVTSLGISATASGASTRIDDCSIDSSPSTGSSSGSSWGVFVSSTMTINASRINESSVIVGGTAASCPPSSTTFCGGIQSGSATLTLTNNVILGVAAGRSAAVYLGASDKPPGEVIVNSNTLDALGLPTLTDNTMSAAIVLKNTSPLPKTDVGRAQNNILLAGRNKSRYGVYEDVSPNGKTAHLGALDNNDFWWTTPTSGHADVAYELWDGVTQTPYSFFALTQSGQFTTPTPKKNFTSDPLLNPTFHLMLGSACIGSGVIGNDTPKVDFENDLRAPADDVGADQYTP